MLISVPQEFLSERVTVLSLAEVIGGAVFLANPRKNKDI